MIRLLKKIPVMSMGTGFISGYNKSKGYHYLWFGSLNDADRQPILWRVLSVKGNGASYQDDGGNACENPLFLLTEDVLGSYPQNEVIRRNSYIKFYDTDSDVDWDLENPSSIWQQSDARKWCQHFEQVCFTEEEHASILSTFKSDKEYHSKRDAYNAALPPIKAAPNILNGDKVFFLSSEEAENNEYGFKDKKTYTAEQEWWTRSFDRYSDYGEHSFLDVGIVLTHFGGLLCAPVGSKMYTRPALNLNHNQVLFASAAIDGKERGLPQTPAVLKKVPKMPERKMKGWKLTLIDEKRNGFSVGRAVKQGDVLIVPYRNAVVYDQSLAPNERISAVVLDSGGTDLKYYGNIALPVSPDGEAQIDLSSIALKTGDRIFVFSEQCNRNRRTDYASRPVELILNQQPVSSQKA